MEALPYIQRFHGKTIVIKLGGHAMVDQEILEMAIRDAVLLQYVGMKVVIVHGGGPEITEKMQAMGKEPKFVGGLRITDLETLEIAQMVLVGKINDGIVSLIARGGARGVGLSGNDGNLMIARKMDPQKVKEGGRVKEVDLGYVGEIETVDPAVLPYPARQRLYPCRCPDRHRPGGDEPEYQCRHSGRRDRCRTEGVQAHQPDRCRRGDGRGKDPDLPEAHHGRAGAAHRGRDGERRHDPEDHLVPQRGKERRRAGTHPEREQRS